MEGKVLPHGKFSFVVTEARGIRALFWFTKNTFFGTLCNDKTTDNDAKRNNNTESYCTYLIKVTYICSILKFLITQGLVVQVYTPDSTSKVYTSEPNRLSSNQASHISFKTTNVCFVFNSKHSKPEASVFQTMDPSANQAAMRLRI